MKTLCTLVAAVLALTAVAAEAQTFGPPSPFNTNAATDAGTHEFCQLATDGTGTWVAVWESDDTLGGTVGGDYDVLVSRSTDGGSNWSAPAALNSDAAVDTTDDSHPEITTDGAGTWVTIWEERGKLGDDYDVFVARSTDGGATWSTAVPLNSNAAVDHERDVFPDVTTDGHGVWIASWWTRNDLGGIGTDGEVVFARSTDGGVTWTAPAPLNSNAASDSGDDQVPQITTDGAGTWVAVWQSYDTLGGTIGFDVDVLTARSTDDGITWSAPAPLNTNAAVDSGDDYFPQVTTDGSVWVAVWFSTDALGGTIGTDVDILTARSTDGGVTWSAPAPLNTNAAADSGDDYSPQVTTDGHGTWIATWTSYDTLGGTIGSESDILLARSTDGGATWSDPEPLSSTAGTDVAWDGNPQLTTDGAGAWIAVWESTESFDGAIGDDLDILTAKVGVAPADPTPTPTGAAEEPTPTPTPTDDAEARCAPAPQSGCRKPGAPNGSAITMKHRAGRDSVAWTWAKGAPTRKADFGDPSAGTSYALCLYDRAGDTATLVSTTVLAAGSTCRSKPCWKSNAHGFKYADGATTLSLKEGMDGNAKIKLGAKGLDLGMPALPFDAGASVTVQLLSGGVCWDADYAAPALRNEQAQFRDRTD